MNVYSNVRRLYAIRLFHNLIPAYVIERLFWEERGMTIQMVVYAEIIYAVTVVLLEVPTGILADRWSRKKMIVLSALLGCLEFLILIYATEFWHFAVVVFLAGIARSASSGAENALLYDSLLQAGKEQRFEKYLGRLNAIDFISAMLAALSGSLMADRYGFEFNYWLSLAAMLISLGVSFTLREPAFKSEADEQPETGQYVRAAVLFFRGNPGVSLVMAAGMTAGASMSFIYEFWQLYLDRLDIPVVYFGSFSAAIMVLGLPGSLLAHAMKNRFGYRFLITGIIGVFALGFVYISVFKDLTALAAICLISMCAGVIEPLAAGYLHHRIGSSMRATLDSFQSLGENAVLILTGLGFGFFSSRWDVFGGFGFVALVCGAVFVFFTVASGKYVE